MGKRGQSGKADKMKKDRWYRIIGIMIFCMSIICGTCTIQAKDQTDADTTTIRVAYYPLDGFFEYDDNGKEIGYGVELLDKISQYTGIQFEYIKADSWEDTKYMLIDGTADLRMPGTKPAIPSTTLSYNETSIISSFDAIMTLDTRDDLYYQDYDMISTLKIAMSRSFYACDDVEEYLNSIGVSMDQIVFVDEYNDCLALLESGEVDALISNIMDLGDDMKMLSRFSNAYNYFSMRLDDERIAVLENALTEIRLDEPNYLYSLYSQWYPKRTTVPYTREESEYIDSVDTLTFAFRPDEGYLSRYENGEFYGIYVEMAKEICENLGLEFHAVNLEDCLSGKETTDIYAGFFYDANYAREWDFAISSPIDDINYYKIRKRESNFDSKTCTIAAIEKFKYTKDYIQTYYPDAKLDYYDTYEECIKAVERGKADMTIVNNYIAEYYLNMYQFSNLSASLSDEYSHLYCFAASNSNTILSSLLSKALNGISEDEMKQIYLRGQQHKPDTNYLLAMFYNNPVQASSVLFFVVFLIVLNIFLILHAKNKRIHNQKLAAALSAKSDFLSRMSHDMRTPMNGILGVTTLMLDQEVPQEIEGGLKQIQMSGEYLLELINDTLDMSKIESGHLELHPTPTAAEEITGNVLNNAKLLADTKKIRLTVTKVHPENIVPVDLYIDRARMEQIFMNLMSNAVKFTPEGGDIFISIERLETADTHITSRYVLRDTGIGMSKEFQEHLFEPFSQEGRSNTNRESGTGLGLAIVKQLVELTHGELRVESELNVGTTFFLTISFERYHGEIQKKDETQFDDSMLAGRRALLCEDHPLNRQIAEKLLEKKGMLVESVENGADGMQKFEASEPGYYDLILMDLRMPVMNGYDATAAIRSLDREDAKTIPIIAMTANAFDEDVKQCLEAGMNAHLSKPIDVNLLYRTMGEFLGK